MAVEYRLRLGVDDGWTIGRQPTQRDYHPVVAAAIVCQPYEVFVAGGRGWYRGPLVLCPVVVLLECQLFIEDGDRLTGFSLGETDDLQGADLLLAPPGSTGADGRFSDLVLFEGEQRLGFGEDDGWTVGRQPTQRNDHPVVKDIAFLLRVADGDDILEVGVGALDPHALFLDEPAPFDYLRVVVFLVFLFIIFLFLVFLFLLEPQRHGDGASAGHVVEGLDGEVDFLDGGCFGPPDADDRFIPGQETLRAGEYDGGA